MTQFNYANMTFPEIVSQISDRLKNDPRFANFSESAIAQTILEIFAGVGDLTNYYIERRAEETYLDTARLQSSIIALTKSIGYVPSRPIPAIANVKILLKGPLPSGLVAGMTIEFFRDDVNLSFNGFNFIFKKTYVYTITQNDIDTGVANTNFLKTIEYSVNDRNSVEINASGNIPVSAATPIQAIQGQRQIFVLTGDSADAKPGQKFQSYNISDAIFSNLYGEEDFSYDYETDTFELDVGLTKVGIGSTSADALSGTNLYEIARRSIITSRTVLDTTQTGVVSNVCLIESNPDQTIKLSFGDGNFSTIGLKSTSDNIFVQYVQTKGSQANQIGVLDQKMSTSNSFYANGNIDVTSNIEFRLNSNITQGADFESIQSMKQNAPGIFASLDRLTTKQDYLSFLRSVTSPIVVKNALAWGEQEEAAIRGTMAVKELFNIIIYCVVGSLYDFSSPTEYGVRQIATSGVPAPVTLFDDYSFGAGYDYYDLNSDALNAIGTQEALPSDDSVTILNTKLNRKGQMTTRAFSLRPIIQYFNLGGRVYVNKLYPLDATRKKINNALYKYFDVNADFNVEIYKSSIAAIIESYPEVNFCDINFTAMDLGNNATVITSAGSSACGAIQGAVDTGIITSGQQMILGPALDSVITSWIYGAATSATTKMITDFNIVTYFSVIARKYGAPTLSGISEEQFWNTLAPNLETAILSLPSWATTWANTYLDLYLQTLNTTLKNILVTNMIDDNGNIVNYTLQQEVPAINISDPTYGLIYTYR